jgi:hypothetical protein
VTAKAITKNDVSGLQRSAREPVRPLPDTGEEIADSTFSIADVRLRRGRLRRTHRVRGYVHRPRLMNDQDDDGEDSALADPQLRCRI